MYNLSIKKDLIFIASSSKNHPNCNGTFFALYCRFNFKPGLHSASNLNSRDRKLAYNIFISFFFVFSAAFYFMYLKLLFFLKVANK